MYPSGGLESLKPRWEPTSKTKKKVPELKRREEINRQIFGENAAKILKIQ